MVDRSENNAQEALTKNSIITGTVSNLNLRNGLRQKNISAIYTQ